MTRDEIIARAIELDDPYGDHVCPGCGLWIEGWEHHWAHYPPNIRVGQWLPQIGAGSGPTPCPWDRDMLTARAFRRQLIRDAQTEVAA